MGFEGLIMTDIGNGTTDNLPHPECFFIIVYPQGNREYISVAEAQDFDVPDYSLASRYWFWNESECIQYARGLARRNNLSFIGPSSTSDFLD